MNEHVFVSSVRGFLPTTENGITNQPDPSQEILHDLSTRKQVSFKKKTIKSSKAAEICFQNLLLELRNYEENMRIAHQSVEQSNQEVIRFGIVPCV